MSALKQLKLEIGELLRTSPRSRSFVARCLAATSRFSRSTEPAIVTKRLQSLCRAARLCASPATMSKIEQRISAILAEITPAGIDWQQIAPDSSSRAIPKGVILKPYVSEREKGVLFISFENQMLRLRNAPLQKLAEQFVIVLAPSWSPPHNLITSAFPLMFPGKLFCLISNTDDVAIIPRISSRYTVVPLFASSWVDPARFDPLPKAQRDIDLLMVANFGAFKRHFAFFKALHDVPRSRRIVLIGQNQDGRTRDTILEEARYQGVADRFEIRSDCPYEEVAKAMCRARATTVFSLREGSCVVVAESLFADTPVALLSNAAIGSSAFINEQTGRFLSRSKPGRALADFIDAADRYRPRQWALENISCHVSSAKLNEILRQSAIAQGEVWTRDIAPLCWKPDPFVVNESDRQRLAAEHARLSSEFGLQFSSG